MRSTKLLSSSKRLLGLDPVPVPPHVFSIGQGWLRYGRFVGADDSFDFQEFHETPLPAGCFHPGPLGGTVKEPELLRERFQAMLEAVTAPVTEASLVLPDAWLRLTFAELDERPARSRADEVLRWKLKKLVPFRVDELRLRGTEAAPLVEGQTVYRVLLGYAMDLLLSQLEDAFAEAGVRVGLSVNRSLALCTALGYRAAADERFAFLHVTDGGYSLVLAAAAQPLFHRFRAISIDSAGNGSGDLVRRDLRLTRDFLAREAAASVPANFVVIAPQAVEEAWCRWVGEAFEVEALGLRGRHLPLRGEQPAARLSDIAPLLGAACHRV